MVKVKLIGTFMMVGSLLTATAFAADCTWTGGAGDGKWSSTANWEGGVVPGAGDIAWLSGSNTATINNDVENLSLVGVYSTNSVPVTRPHQMAQRQPRVRQSARHERDPAVMAMRRRKLFWEGLLSAVLSVGPLLSAADSAPVPIDPVDALVAWAKSGGRLVAVGADGKLPAFGMYALLVVEMKK